MSMNDQWNFYFCRVNDALSSIFVDLGRHASAPDRQRPHLLWVWIPLRHPRSDGLSSSEESPRLNAIDDILAQALDRELDAVFVGRITGSSRRELYFYAPSAMRAAETVQKIAEEYSDYEFTFDDQPDPDWTHYFEVLYPSPRELQRIRNRQVLEALEAEGDPLTEPRPITHWIYFTEPADVPIAMSRLVAAGFDVEQTGGANADDSLGLRLEKMSAVDQNTIDEVVLGIMDLLEGLDFSYDGWECPVMKAARKRGFLDRFRGLST